MIRDPLDHDKALRRAVIVHRRTVLYRRLMRRRLAHTPARHLRSTR